MEQLTKAPTWKIESLEDSPTPKLVDFSGKTLLLLFFNIGCPTCLGRAVPYAIKWQKQFPDLKVVAIHTHFESSAFPAEQIQINMDRQNVKFPVVMDKGHQTWSAYEAGGTPHWVLINEKGEIDKSIFGSMPNALQRLDYALIESFQNKNQ